jgi:hypothetical protein
VRTRTLAAVGLTAMLLSACSADVTVDDPDDPTAQAPDPGSTDDGGGEEPAEPSGDETCDAARDAIAAGAAGEDADTLDTMLDALDDLAGAHSRLADATGDERLVDTAAALRDIEAATAEFDTLDEVDAAFVTGPPPELADAFAVLEQGDRTAALPTDLANELAEDCDIDWPGLLPDDLRLAPPHDYPDDEDNAAVEDAASDLRNVAVALETHYTEHGTYPDALDDLTQPPSTNVDVALHISDDIYCLEARLPDTAADNPPDATYLPDDGGRVRTDGTTC